MTSGIKEGEEGPLWTIAGNQAEQSLTRGPVRRLRYRPSRLRLQRRGVPGDAQEWPQTRHGGVHDHAEMQRQFRASGAGRPPDHMQHVKKKRTRGSARGRANSSSRHQGTTLRRRCVYGARGARLTHSQTATPESKHSSSQQTG